jgi:hypothetical protein
MSEYVMLDDQELEQIVGAARMAVTWRRSAGPTRPEVSPVTDPPAEEPQALPAPGAGQDAWSLG